MGTHPLYIFFYGMECSPIMGNYSLIFYTSCYIYLKPIGFIFVLEKIVSFPKDQLTIGLVLVSYVALNSFCGFFFTSIHDFVLLYTYIFELSFTELSSCKAIINVIIIFA